MTNTTKQNIDQLSADTIRLLSADGIQKANSGHPGLPMGMADCAHVLWTKYMNFNPDDPNWINRDRFILSAGHGAMLLYSLLYLNGFDISMDDLKSFRQWESKTPGHPEYGHLDGVDTTTGPLGQGFSNGVGMAIASKFIAAKFNSEGYDLFGTHKIYGIVSDGDLMEGVSAEAASIAGHLGLGNIVYLYDDNNITIEGSTEIAFTENVEARFNAYGWHTVTVDGHNFEEIAAAIKESRSETAKPSLIICKTHIGHGSPNKHDTAGVHGSPLGPDELKLTKENLGFPTDKEFYVPEEVSEFYLNNVELVKNLYVEWKNMFDEWSGKNSGLAKEFDNMLNRKVPDNLVEELLSVIDDTPLATRALSGKVMQKIADLLPGFIGGSADLAPSNSTHLKEFGSISKNNFNNRNMHFGIREHAMGAILNGMILYGGIRPFGGTFLVFSDYMRPSIRLAALMKLPVIYVFTHDSIFVGEDGPTHQPIEHVAALRTIPNVDVFRPADGTEVAMAWSYALKRNDGPVALILTRQKLPVIIRDKEFNPADVDKGGYIVSKEVGYKPGLVIVATGSELGVAVGAKELLANKDSVRIVSMPSVDVYIRQSDEYKRQIIPEGSKVVTIEAGITGAWSEIAPGKILKIGIDRFGASAPYELLAEKFGLTSETVADKIRNWKI